MTVCISKGVYLSFQRATKPISIVYEYHQSLMLIQSIFVMIFAIRFPQPRPSWRLQFTLMAPVLAQMEGVRFTAGDFAHYTIISCIESCSGCSHQSVFNNNNSCFFKCWNSISNSNAASTTLVSQFHCARHGGHQ